MVLVPLNLKLVGRLALSLSEGRVQRVARLDARKSALQGERVEPSLDGLAQWVRHLCWLTLALPGTQPVPRSGSLWLRVRAEQLVSLFATN